MGVLAQKKATSSVVEAVYREAGFVATEAQETGS